MAVRFILGRSGTGKTRHCTDSIIDALLQDDGGPLVLLVPEQASYQAEKAILSDGRVRGYSRLHVLSFNRLGFMLLGRRMALGALSRSGQEMAVQAILAGNADRLTTLVSAKSMPGLAAETYRSLVEFQQCGMEPDDVANLAAGMAERPGMGASSRKFIDLALVYRLYREFLGTRFNNPDMELTEARRAVPKASFLEDARLWVDGFAGFTRQEFELLIEVLKVSRQSEIALCLDPTRVDLHACKRENLEPTGLFYPTECTYADLIEAVRKCRLTTAEPLILDRPRRFTSPAIARIEESMAGVDGPRTDAAGAVRLLAASNERAEAEFAAREIRRLTRASGYRYRDVAVVAPDVGAYIHYIEAAFQDCGIPFFVDVPKPFVQYPLAEMVLSALRAVSEGFRNTDVLAFLKSGLGPLPADDVNLLENYCLASGADGTDWTSDQPWKFAARGAARSGEDRMDALRRAAILPLVNLAKALSTPDGTLSPEAFASAVFGMVEDLHVRTVLGTWTDNAEEHRRFFDRFVGIFDELGEVFAGTTMPPAEFQSILRSTIEGATLAIIPPKLDQVLVGAIERSRHPDIKAAILIGCCQGQFPSPLRRGSVLTDEDRQAAEDAGLRLGETVASQLAARQYLAYIAFTRASERLYLSWPLAGEDGSATSQSEFAGELATILSNLPVESITQDAASGVDVPSAPHLADLLCARLGRDTSREALADRPIMTGLFDGLKGAGELPQVTGLVEDSLRYTNAARLDENAAAMAFGQEVLTSVTRMSSFAACPYQHFAGYMLDLSPREQFRFEPLDLGSFYHGVLDKLTRALLAQGKDFSRVPESELLQGLHAAIDAEISSHSFLAAFRSRSPHNAFIIEQAADTLEGCVRAIATCARAGKLRTVASELVFGLGGKGLAALKLSLRGGRTLLLRGKIDRLDVAPDGDAVAAFVFDYKTSPKNVKWSDIYYGLDLQLPVYLLAMAGRRIAGVGEVIPAGAFFFPLQVPRKTMTIGDVVDDVAAEAQHRATGLFNGQTYTAIDPDAGQFSSFYNFSITKDDGPYGRYGTSGAMRPDDFERLLAFVRRKLQNLAEQMVAGTIDVHPYRIANNSPCANCDYRPVCRFDWQVNDYNFLTGMSKDDVLNELRGANG